MDIEFGNTLSLSDGGVAPPTPTPTPTPPSVAGTTRVQLCGPWQARDCPRAGIKLTCAEFKQCQRIFGQGPCRGEEWFTKCGW